MAVMSIRGRYAPAAAAIGICFCGLGLPAISHAAGASPLEGDWVRTDINGSGDFGGLAAGYQQAQLTQLGSAAVARARQAAANRLKPLKRAPHKAGEPYIVVQQPCLLNNLASAEGALGVNPDSGAIHIVVSRYQVVIAPERDGLRVIYLDGRSHPPPSLLTPTGGGNSIGHFQDGELIVDTIGMTAGMVPAGGWRLPSTRLVEHFSVSADGQHMRIQYTWTDPKVYVKPHTYTYAFDRLPAGSYAFEEWCDPSDPAEYSSIVPPPQS
jgi:hypothetical protein